MMTHPSRSDAVSSGAVSLPNSVARPDPGCRWHQSGSDDHIPARPAREDGSTRSWRPRILASGS